MRLEEQLKRYGDSRKLEPDEEQIQKTIWNAKEAFLSREAGKTMSRTEFLLTQLGLIQKRWWLLQLLVLGMLWLFIPTADDILYAYRSMGVAGTLFAVLIIPELWKNRTYQALEVEAAAFYSLRQIYAARMLILGTADVLFLTVFCGAASFSLQISAGELLVQFLFPMAVTACICFGILCSSRYFSQAVAVGMCLIWSILWWFVLLDEELYQAVTLPIWCGLLCAAALFLAYAVNRSLSRCGRNMFERQWEM